jgi:TPR repeat protein
MKKALLFVLALAAIPVGVDAQGTELAQLRALAEQGNAVAQNDLGVRYGNGRGVPEDHAEAARWYRLAAEQGRATAQFLLGNMYDVGEGVPEDDVEAVRWYRRSADQGDANAQMLLGIKYSKGEGVPEDFVVAYMWYNLTAAQGTENGQELKDLLERQMTREQIAEAQRMSREWLEAHPPGGN